MNKLIQSQQEQQAQEMTLVKEEKIQNYFLVMGTENGAPFSKNGNFVRDDENKLVVSKVEINILEDKFKEANSYIKRASPTDEDIKEVLNDMELKKLDKSKIDSNNVRKWNEFYQIPLFISFILLLVSLFCVDTPFNLFTRVTHTTHKHF